MGTVLIQQLMRLHIQMRHVGTVSYVFILSCSHMLAQPYQMLVSDFCLIIQTACRHFFQINFLLLFLKHVLIANVNSTSTIIAHTSSVFATLTISIPSMALINNVLYFQMLQILSYQQTAHLITASAAGNNLIMTTLTGATLPIELALLTQVIFL